MARVAKRYDIYDVARNYDKLVRNCEVDRKVLNESRQKGSPSTGLMGAADLCFCSSKAVVICEIKLFQNYFSR